MDFKEAIKMPVHLDELCCYIWTYDFHRIFSCMSIDRGLLKNVVCKLNQTSAHRFDANYHDEIIYIDGKAVLLVRGWGYLTRTGGLNLSPEVAAKIQDDFCEWCVKVLRT